AALGCVALVLAPQFSPPRALRRTFALGLALASIATFYEFFSTPGPAFFHRWEMFHYVLGAKYARELGYEGLYVCVAVADAGNGHTHEVRSRVLRDLRNDELREGANVLDDPNSCRGFSPARWSTFRSDVAAFRGIVANDETWAAMQTDHGY